MKHKTLFCLMVVAAAFAGNAEAIFKCKTAKGVVYQDRPCQQGTETDVQIVIPTGELAPRAMASQDDPTQTNSAATDDRYTPKQGRASGDNSPAVTRPTDRSSNATATNSSDDARRKDARSAADNSVPMTAEQARKTESMAKYLTTDVTASGSETPEHMTCESPSGEKRRFILTNGKMTSI